MRYLEYDLANAIGDTIFEKYEALFNIIKGWHDISPVRFLIGHPEVTSILEVQGSFEPASATDFVERDYELTYCGRMLIYPYAETFVRCYKSEMVAKNELVLFCENENASIKILNYGLE